MESEPRDGGPGAARRSVAMAHSIVALSRRVLFYGKCETKYSINLVRVSWGCQYMKPRSVHETSIETEALREGILDEACTEALLDASPIAS